VLHAQWFGCRETNFGEISRQCTVMETKQRLATSMRWIYVS
jgi:hypothetical protein